MSRTSITFTTIAVSVPTELGITTIALQRPSRLNAFTRQMADELESAFGALSDDAHTRVIVLKGEGRIFCAGADLVDFGRGDQLPNDHRDEGGRVSLAIHHCKKPTIAVIHGAAVGVGITMTLPCALRIATRDAKIALPFVKRGLVMEGCSSFFLPRILGYSKAQRLFVTGDTVLAGGIEVDGLFHELCDTPQDAERRGYEIAEGIAKQGSGTAVEAVRRIMWNVQTPEEAHLVESKVILAVKNGPDVKEGANAFLEKRLPKFGKTADVVGQVMARDWGKGKL